MSIKKLSDNIYSVGVTNPSLRIFDIVMYAPYGTTYNSYLVKGSEKIALIETVHEDFFDEFIENILSICDATQIDYVILNHTEPDHTGSLAKLLALNPNIQVFGTAAARKYIADITNTIVNFSVIKAGETLSLGDKELQFCPAPFLHWPDSMFTFESKSRTAFTCDFLGCHFCEPGIFDSKVRYLNEYNEAFKYYFDCIFGPFQKYVLEGLEKLELFSPRMICPSHGPVLTNTITSALAKYRSYCDFQPKNKMFAVFYASAYGFTRTLAAAAAAAASDAGFETHLIDIVTDDLSMSAEIINSADGFMIGTDTINRDAPKIVWDLLASIDAISTMKPVGVFGSYGWSGEAVPMVASRLSGLRFKLISEPMRVVFKPTDDDIKKVKDYTLSICSSIS